MPVKKHGKTSLTRTTVRMDPLGKSIYWDSKAKIVSNALLPCAVVACALSSLSTLYTAVMSFEILFPFGLGVFEPDWLPCELV